MEFDVKKKRFNFVINHLPKMLIKEEDKKNDSLIRIKISIEKSLDKIDSIIKLGYRWYF
jgi:hypothetical protein